MTVLTVTTAVHLRIYDSGTPLFTLKYRQGSAAGWNVKSASVTHVPVTRLDLGRGIPAEDDEIEVPPS